MKTHPDPTDDGRLAAAARAGSLDALAELYRRHADAVHAVAYRLTGSAADASDVLQDVFVGLPRALERYREQGSFAAWLKQVAARVSLMRLRAERRRGERPLDETQEAGNMAAPDLPVEWQEMRRALAALPDAYRAVFVLKEIEGYTHAEIAGMLGISSGAAATRLSRAWTVLRRELKP